MKLRRLSLIFLILLPLSCGDSPEQIPSKTDQIEVIRGPFEKRFIATGELRAEHSTQIRVPPVGRSYRMNIASLVEHGSYVNKGDLVVSFDASNVEQEIHDNEMRLAEIDNEIRMKRMTARREIMEIEEDLEVKRLEIQKPELYLKIDPSLLTPEDLDKWRYQKNLILLDLRDYERKIKHKREEHQYAMEELQIRKAKIVDTLERNRSHVEKMQIKAPSSGYALCQTNWQENRPLKIGDEVYMGRVLIDIPEMRGMEAVLEISEVDAYSLKVGLEAEISLDIHPDKVFTGTIKKIANVIHEKGGWRSKLKAIEVVLSLDVWDPELMKPGMSLRASILQERRDNLLLVPRNAVQYAEGGPAVQVVNSAGSAEVRQVDILDRNVEWVAISSGLQEGEKILPTWEERAQGI
ncbi:efflux RND transporter periplasmic adaptor subunit [Acidobacteriota bacterium]